MSNTSISNILIFINTLDKGGAELQAVELSRALADNFNVYLGIFYGERTHPELLERLSGTAVHLIRFSGVRSKLLFELHSAINDNQIDCIYSFLALTNYYAAIAKRKFKVKYLITGFRNSYYGGVKFLVQKYIHNHIATASVVNSYHGREYLIQHGLNEKKLITIQNAFVPSNQFQIDIHKSDIPQIISVARFVPQKDYATAVAAIKTIREKRPDLLFRYLIIGFGDLEEQIRHLLHESSLEDCVQLIINPPCVPKYLLESDIFLQTSLFEGTSNAILEAMYAKLPIVATNVGDNNYLVTEENGYLTEIKDVEMISNHIIQILEDKNLRVSMGERSQQIVCDKFGIDSFRENNIELLNSLSQ